MGLKKEYLPSPKNTHLLFKKKIFYLIFIYFIIVKYNTLRNMDPPKILKVLH
jgi:hypothetical protein